MAVINFKTELKKLIQSKEYLFSASERAATGSVYLLDVAVDAYAGTTYQAALGASSLSIVQTPTPLLISHTLTDLDLVLTDFNDFKTLAKASLFSLYKELKARFDAIHTALATATSITAAEAVLFTAVHAKIVTALAAIATATSYTTGSTAYDSAKSTFAGLTFAAAQDRSINPLDALDATIDGLFTFIFKDNHNVVESLYTHLKTTWDTAYTAVVDKTNLTPSEGALLNALKTQIVNVLTLMESLAIYPDVAGIDTASSYDSAKNTFSGTTFAGSTDYSTNPLANLDTQVTTTFFTGTVSPYFAGSTFYTALGKYLTAVEALPTGVTTFSPTNAANINAAIIAFNNADPENDYLLLADVLFKPLRDSLLALEKSDLTTSEWRALIDIDLALSIGNIDEVSLDGSTYKTIAGTIGTEALTTSVKASLAAAINTAGDIASVDINGDSTGETDFTSTIGTEALTTSVKTSLVDAINAIATRSDNIINGLTAFYGCTNGVQDVTINPPTTSTEAELYYRIAQCIKYSASTNDLGKAVVSGGECTDITSRGDALVYCIGSIVTVADYS